MYMEKQDCFLRIVSTLNSVVDTCYVTMIFLGGLIISQSDLGQRLNFNEFQNDVKLKVTWHTDIIVLCGHNWHCNWPFFYEMQIA